MTVLQHSLLLKTNSPEILEIKRQPMSGLSGAVAPV